MTDKASDTMDFLPKAEGAAAKEWLGRDGHRLNFGVLERIFALMSCLETDGQTQKALAAQIGIHERTLARYLTAEVWAEIKRRRLLALEEKAFLALDRTIYARALKGDLAAAKLIYARWDKVRADAKKNSAKMEERLSNDAVDIADVDEALAQLRAELAVLE